MRAFTTPTPKAGPRATARHAGPDATPPRRPAPRRAAMLLPAFLLAATVQPLRAASPQGFNLQVSPPGLGLPVPPQPPAAGSSFRPAPLPNRDLELATPKASTETTVGPSLFTRPDQYRGDGFSKGNTAQSEQEKRLRPAAGFSLKMPLAPN